MACIQNFKEITMKKTLLLSVVASTMIMAGGDIAPVEPVVEAPAAAAWDFSGQLVVYYQTTDANDGDLFDQASSAGDFGVQLRAMNSDVVAGIGAGFEVSGLSTLNLENWMVSNVPQATGDITQGGDIDDVTDGGWISQAYLTYGFGSTTIKAGRQELPKALSPFAFSESWNVFKNTFDSVLVVNTGISNTTIVGAWVAGANYNDYGVFGTQGNGMSNITDFNSVNDSDGVYMLTAQNKSFENVTLTGSWYYGADMGVNDDINILWGDAAFGVAGINIGIQGGSVMGDAAPVNPNDTTAWGAKAGYDFGMINASVSYSSVDDGDTGVFNVGGIKTPLYTQMILNQNFIASDSDTWVFRAGMDALGGTFGVAYNMSDVGANGARAGAGDYNELDITYTTKVADIDVFAGYMYQDADQFVDSSVNNVRIWGRYNF